MRILFQGDSITDTVRTHIESTWSDAQAPLGVGYPLSVCEELFNENPFKYDIINKACSGNRIIELYGRVKRDIINLKPDVLSILIGVNDAWRELDENNGTNPNRFFEIYQMMIEDILNALPDVKILLLEPFINMGCETKERFSEFRNEVVLRAKETEKIATKFNLIFVPLQDAFDKAESIAPSNVWTIDGVHPTMYGHQIIKREWMKFFRVL
jgi:lysophospholipase L1-like esterase